MLMSYNKYANIKGITQIMSYSPSILSTADRVECTGHSVEHLGQAWNALVKTAWNDILNMVTAWKYVLDTDFSVE